MDDSIHSLFICYPSPDSPNLINSLSASLHSSPPISTLQGNMNPNDFYLRQQPVASTSTSSQPQLDQSTSSTNASSLNQDKPKTQKESEQEKKDAELAELLEQMDQYKPVVRLSLSLSNFLSSSVLETALLMRGPSEREPTDSTVNA